MAKANISCGNCFYSFNSTDIQPCITCNAYSKWVPNDIYKEDIMVTDYDIVHKPKHYMLFEDKGIEVRHVIEKLLEKLDNSPLINPPPMAFSDYAQAMQYVMRFMDKGGIQDLEKAVWYFNKLIEQLRK